MATQKGIDAAKAQLQYAYDNDLDVMIHLDFDGHINIDTLLRRGFYEPRKIAPPKVNKRF